MPIPKRALITAALPYSNGRLHVGHIVGAYLPADTYVRYLRMQGSDVRFVCGSDDHGVAIMLTALKENKTPAQVAEFYGEKQARDFAALAIDFDIYSSTSRNPHHAKTSQDFFKNMLDKGYFQKETTRQFYDESTKSFLPDRFVKVTCGYCGAPDQNSDQCEQCGKMLDVESAKDPRSVMSGNVATIRETVHWFLDLSRFEQAVRDWLKSAELRDHTRSYVEGLLSTGLVKRSMTRDLSWG
ncbi:MAG: methionine--tRNA ligase, partial [Proteobacteria bacterium]